MKRINFKSKSGIMLCCAMSVLLVGAEDKVTEIKNKEESTGITPTPVSAPGADKKEGESAEEAVEAEKSTLRITFREVPEACKHGLYMMKENGAYERLPMIIGLFSPRVDMPKDGVVTVYDKEPVDGQPQGNKLFSAKVPEGVKGDVLGIIIPNKDGSYEMLFINESSIKPGRVFLANTTKESLGLTVGKDQMKEYAPGEQIYLDLGFTLGGSKNLHPIKLHRKDAKGKWYVTRTYALLCREGVSEIALLVWNESLQRPDVQKFSIGKENVRTN